jgi:predicted dehydrogenase
MPSDLNVLLVGAGSVAIAYGQVLNALGVSWTAVGRGDASAEKFEAACGVRPARGGLESHMRDSASLSQTIAIIALPIPDLAGAAINLASKGFRRILVEKPAGLVPSEIGDVAQAAARTHADIFVAYNRRFYSSVQAARRIISEDGGVTSFTMEFTEIESRVLNSARNTKVLANWFLANSTHVVDLAFHLCGEPVEATGLAAGASDWHPAGSIFVGHGRTKTGAAFTWHADWSSAGRWGLDVRTNRRRLLLQPLEQLAVQEKGSFAISQFPIADELDRNFKPGLYREVEAFLSDKPATAGLPTIAEHHETVRRWFSKICPQPSKVLGGAVLTEAMPGGMR